MPQSHGTAYGLAYNPAATSFISFGHPQNLLSRPTLLSSLGSLSSLERTIPTYCLKPLGRLTGAATFAVISEGMYSWEFDSVISIDPVSPSVAEDVVGLEVEGDKGEMEGRTDWRCGNGR